MEAEKKLLNEISQLLGNIESNYPELYRTFEEVPVKMTSAQNEDLKNEELKDYLETLKVHLKNHIKLHQKNKLKVAEKIA